MAWGSRMASGAVALVVAAAVALYMTTDSDVVSTTCYLGVLVGTGVVACVGAERAPAGRRLVPRLIAVGISISALGDVLWTVLDLRGMGTDVSIADPPWLASYVVLCAALWIVLNRSRGRSASRVDVDFVVDVVTIVVVSMLIFWSISIDTIIADQSVTPFVRTLLVTYPVADAILLALVVRVLMSRSARAAIGVTFAGGVCLWLAADLAYLHASDNDRAMVLADTAWMLAPVLMARAAWRADDRQPVASGSSASGSLITPITVAIGPLLVPPALELVADLRGASDRPLQLFIGTAALIALAFVRTARLIRSEARARHELEVARDVALEASLAKSMFLANVSHEIRTPLTTVLAVGEILEDTPLDELQLKLLTKMHRSGELLKRLVEGLLDFSKIEAGELTLVSSEFDLHDMLADTADVYRPRAVEAGIRFEWHLDPGVPRTVVGDCDRLLQVLTNLLDNALKFTPQGQVTLRVRPWRAHDDVDVMGGVELTVTDTGIGIREEDLEAVFESFHQVDGSATRRYGGSGLGLAICKELIELMGGSIAVQSQLGVGCTFVVRLPVAPTLAQAGSGATACRQDPAPHLPETDAVAAGAGRGGGDDHLVAVLEERPLRVADGDGL